jgi:hypothetical protein
MSRLFGLDNTNRDFSAKESWGKNQFNSSFPASLSCYLDSKSIRLNYIINSGSETQIVLRSFASLLGVDEGTLKDCRFDFEWPYDQYRSYCNNGDLPRTDLVISSSITSKQIAGLEVKLTALPDNITCDLSDEEYGSEIVIRPDTIVYLACSVAARLGGVLRDIDEFNNQSISWLEHDITSDILKSFSVALSEAISLMNEQDQTPFLLHPIWKTDGKSPALCENCLDVFLWSDAAFVSMIIDAARVQNFSGKITRQIRTLIWLFRMVRDINLYGQMNHKSIIDELSYNTKNDKAFASSGKITNRYMSCERLTVPIITASEIKNIILDGGQFMLSPERRFDAVLTNAKGIFDESS